MDDQAHGKAHEAVDLAHPLGVTLGQVVVDGDDVNWSPYIPRNILLRYSKEGDLVLDQFAGGGTTLVEAKLLNRCLLYTSSANFQ